MKPWVLSFFVALGLVAALPLVTYGLALLVGIEAPEIWVFNEAFIALLSLISLIPSLFVGFLLDSVGFFKSEKVPKLLVVLTGASSLVLYFFIVYRSMGQWMWLNSPLMALGWLFFSGGPLVTLSVTKRG